MEHIRNAPDAALRNALSEAIGRFTGSECEIRELVDVSGGSISRTVIAHTRSAPWFVKLNSADHLQMFVAEADGLNALSACSALRVPEVVAHGVSGQVAYLVLEFLDLRPLRESRAGEHAGRALADLHRIKGLQCGWHRTNFIGSTPQANDSERSWPLFFARQRLLPQLELAARNGYRGRMLAAGQCLAEKLPALFVNRCPDVSLLHGDLWHGNAALVEPGTLALFDPAVYYGDRETDLAMSTLFGGFPDSFHAAYREAWPLLDGFEQRRTLYNLYHVLNHFNLFGGGYLHQAERMIGSLLAEIG